MNVKPREQVKLRQSNTHFEPLKMSGIPIGPWKKKAIDYFGPSPFDIHLLF